MGWIRVPDGPGQIDARTHGLSSHLRRNNHERRMWWLARLVGVPGSALAMILLWTGDFTPKVQWTLTLVLLGGWLVPAAMLFENVVYPLRTISNMLAALREGDFSMRARGARTGDALGEVLLEVNALGATLRDQRLGAVEATALLRKVMAAIDVAVFSFDSSEKLCLVNRQGERLLNRPAERVLGASASDLGLQECLTDDTPRVADMAFPGEAGRWEVRRSVFREGGMPHQLLVLANVTRALREGERLAWQRLIQVLRHEINNSLAPIDSLAGTLENLLTRSPRPDDWEADVCEGLEVIRNRSQALNRFMTAYSRLARLPKPRLGQVNVATSVARAAGLETRLAVTVEAGPDMTVRADGDQLEQVLINLVRNATDAALETGGAVRMGWRTVGAKPDWLEVWVDDEGPGLPTTDNLFVPFFTTKPEGSGIGLALSRQIAEAHGGKLLLKNRPGGSGCRAMLQLPLD